MDTEKKNLQDLRQAIDLVDSEILKQFEKRMDLCEQIAEYKIGAGRPVQDMEREKQKIAALQAQADNEFNQHSVAELFAQIM